jgi:ribonuclease P protein subunit RPR2
MRGRRKPRWQQKIAKERISILFDLALKELKKHPERSIRYVELARKIGLRYNVRLRKLKRVFCKKCNTVLIPGYTSRIRISSKEKIIKIKCLNCQKIYRYPYKK